MGARDVRDRSTKFGDLTMARRKNKKMKKPKQRNYVVLGLIERKGMGAGSHSERKYTRRVKHKNKDFTRGEE